jgi:signal transduction histidine kinase/DNA-binding response OmpR family regulator
VPSPSPDPGRERVDILIVDDVPSQRLSIETVLAELDERVVAVDSGREALRYLLDHDVAVILLDVNMPEMDGFETAAMIRQRPRSRSTPIIFLTADTDELHAARGYSLGAVDYLFSPFLPEILRTKVRVFVELARMSAQARRHAEQRVALAAEQAARAAAEDSNRRLQILAEATRVLTQPLERGSIATDLLGTVLPLVADVAGLVLLEPPGVAGPDALWLCATPTGRLEPPTDSPAMRELQEAAQRVVASQKLETLTRPETGATWAVVTPLRARGTTLGAMGFAMMESGRRYMAADLDLARDLASRTAIALDNRSLYREIEERDRRKDEFLAMLAHELRNPLGAISNAITVLDEIGSKTDDATSLRAVIGRQTQHLARLVDDLLDVARVTTGRIVVERRPVALTEVVERALQAATASGKTAHHELTWSGEPVWIRGDASRLEQIVSNLVDNAVRYTPRAGRIEVRVAREGAEAVLRVRDTGQGIPEALLPRIFDLFVRGTGSHERATGGLGLGLTLVRRLVELQGGTVEALSAGAGLGSEFVVRLPVGEPPASAAAGAPVAPPARAANILIIEDNDDARETLRVLLEMDGHAVATATNGEEGLDRALADGPEIALIDLGLPGLDGFEVARRLRAEPRGAGIHLVAISGYGQPTDRARAHGAGFNAHLVKPVDAAKLRAALVHEPPDAAAPPRD